MIIEKLLIYSDKELDRNKRKYGIENWNISNELIDAFANWITYRRTNSPHQIYANSKVKDFMNSLFLDPSAVSSLDCACSLLRDLGETKCLRKVNDFLFKGIESDFEPSGRSSNSLNHNEVYDDLIYSSIKDANIQNVDDVILKITQLPSLTVGDTPSKVKRRMRKYSDVSKVNPTNYFRPDFSYKLASKQLRTVDVKKTRGRDYVVMVNSNINSRFKQEYIDNIYSVIVKLFTEKSQEDTLKLVVFKNDIIQDIVISSLDDITIKLSQGTYVTKTFDKVINEYCTTLNKNSRIIYIHSASVADKSCTLNRNVSAILTKESPMLVDSCIRTGGKIVKLWQN